MDTGKPMTKPAINMAIRIIKRRCEELRRSTHEICQTVRQRIIDSLIEARRADVKQTWADVTKDIRRCQKTFDKTMAQYMALVQKATQHGFEVECNLFYHNDHPKPLKIKLTDVHLAKRADEIMERTHCDWQALHEEINRWERNAIDQLEMSILKATDALALLDSMPTVASLINKYAPES